MKVRIPKSTKTAMSYETHVMLKSATLPELEGLIIMNTFGLVNTSDPTVAEAVRKTGGPLPSHVVYNAKFSSDVPRKFLKAKARLVAGGNFDPAPDNAFENFSPTAGPVSNRLVDVYATMMGHGILSTDCTQAFLNSVMENEIIFVRRPRGMESYFPSGEQLRLNKYLYGLKGAPKELMKTLTIELIQHGFAPFGDDPCLFLYTAPGAEGQTTEILTEVFVDDIEWATNNVDHLKSIIARIGDKFQITVGKTPVNSTNRDTVDWTEAEISTYLGMR